MTWNLKANLRGPAGYNATGAAEDAAAIGAFLRGASGANDANAALTELAGLNIKTYGGKGDGRQNATAAMTSGSPTLTVSPGVFTAADAGKIITVYGAGAAGATLSTTILSYTSATQVTLGASAATTVSAATIFWGTDNTPAIRAAIVDAFPAKSIVFPTTGSGNFYQMSDTVTIDETRPNIRIKGSPRDGYAVSIRCFVANETMFSVKAPSVVFKDIGIWGDSLGTNGGNGYGATVTGIESFGDINGNCDTQFDGVTFQALAQPVRLRARNNLIEGCLFSNCLNGILIDGIDSAYHTGPFAADQNRGNTIRGNRFHNIGTSAANAAVEVSTTAKVLHAIISDNFFDSNGLGTHVRATGTAAAPHERIDLDGNKHTELHALAYDLTYVNNYELSSARINGPIAGTYSLDAIKLNNCTNFVVADINLYRIGRSGIVGTNNTSGEIRGVRAKSLGLDPAGGVIGHGFDFDSTNTGMRFSNLSAESGDGWGFIGNPVNSSMSDSDFTMNLGRISSTTIVNAASSGVNRFLESGRGRIEDVAVQSYDFTAAVAKTVATIAAGGTFNTFVLEIEFSGNSAGNAVSYIFAKRVINPGGGTPVITTIGTDATALATLTIATAGTTSVSVAVTTTNAVFGTVRIKTSAGGAANSVNPRGATVTMA